MIRAGLELDPDKLWELRVMVAKATFIPCFMEVPAINVTFTMIWWQAGSVAILAHFLCGFPWTVGFAVGFLLAAVSLAVSWFWWFWSWKANNRYFFRIIVWECSLGDHSSHPAVDRSGLGPGKGGDDNEQDHEVWWTRWSRNHVIASLLLLESLAGIATYFSGHSDTCHLCLCCRWCRCNIRVRCIIIIIQWKCTNYWFLVSFGIFLGISFSEDADTTQLLLHGPIEVKTIMENTITSYRTKTATMSILMFSACAGDWVWPWVGPYWDVASFSFKSKCWLLQVGLHSLYLAWYCSLAAAATWHILFK